MNRKQKRAAQRAKYERDKREVGDIKSTSGHGTIKLAGLRPPKPDRFVSRRGRDQIRAAQERGLS